MSDLNEIASIVNSTLDVDMVKDTISTRACRRLFRFDQMGVFLLEVQRRSPASELWTAGVPFGDGAWSS